MNDFGSVRTAVSAVAPRYAIARAAMFDFYENDESRISASACLLLDVGCTFSRADAAQFRRFVAEELGCTVDVVLRSALSGEDAKRAQAEARIVYENPDVALAAADTANPAAPAAPAPPAPQPPAR